MVDLMRLIAGVVGHDRIPSGVDVGDIYPDAIAAAKAWTALGGKASGLKVAPVGDGTWTHIRDPAASTGTVQTSGVVPPAARPPSSGGLPGAGVANPGGGVAQPPTVPAFSRNSVSVADASNLPPDALIDPEGRLLTAPFVAGVRAPGGADVPFSPAEQRALADRLFAGGVHDDPNFLANNRAYGQAAVQMPGMAPTPADPEGLFPFIRMFMDTSNGGPGTPQYDTTFPHEVGHGIDFSSERTGRTEKMPITEIQNIPPHLLPELHAASQELRPDLWASQQPGYDPYRKRPTELMADAYKYYMTNPAGFKAKYPETAKWMRSVVNEDPLLSQHIQLNVKAGPPKPAQVPTEDKKPDPDSIGDYRFPVGNIPLPGGIVLNDLLTPFTDSRSDDKLLPDDLSLNDVGRAFAGLSPGAQVRSHMEAQAGRTVEGEPVEGFARLMGLFPAAGADMGIAPAGRNTVGSAIFRRAEGAPLDMSPEARAARAAAQGYTIDAFHGSGSPDITAFDPGLLGANTGAKSATKGFFFSKSPETAGSYYGSPERYEVPLPPEFEASLKAVEAEKAALQERIAANWEKIKPYEDAVSLYLKESNAGKIPTHRYEDLNRLHQELAPYFDERNSLTHQDTQLAQRIYEINQYRNKWHTPQTMYPVKLKMENPLVHDFEGARYRDVSYADLITKAKRGRRDGLVLQNTYDGGPKDDVYVVFRPDQIRSRFAAFDPEKAGDPNILSGRAGVPMPAPTNEPPPGVDPERFVPMDPALAAFLKMGGM